jgi:hypothetical protein
MVFVFFCGKKNKKRPVLPKSPKKAKKNNRACDYHMRSINLFGADNLKILRGVVQFL